MKTKIRNQKNPVVNFKIQGSALAARNLLVEDSKKKQTLQQGGRRPGGCGCC